MPIYEECLEPMKMRHSCIFLHFLEFKKNCCLNAIFLIYKSVVLTKLEMVCFLRMAGTCTKLFTGTHNYPKSTSEPRGQPLSGAYPG